MQKGKRVNELREERAMVLLVLPHRDLRLGAELVRG